MSREVPLRTLIQRLSSLSFRSPAFTSSLEEEFTSDASGFQRRRRWLEGTVAIALYAIAGMACDRMAPHQVRFESLLRYGLVLPILIAVNVSMWLRLRPWVHETLIVAASCVAGTAELLAHGIGTDGIAHLAVIAVLIFTNAVMRVRPPYALVSVAWAVAGEVWLLHPLHGGALQVEGLEAGMVLGLGFLTLVANYSQDREARLAFLRHAQKADLVGTLAQSNEELAAVALCDSLTGLANRSALDIHLDKVWTEPLLAGAPCSVVMVDIDHFKSLNDRYGHLYGDRVIKRVAHLLAEALRGDEDFIARYGGEEFLIVLPNTPLELGLRVAERVRSLVELAGLPSLRSGDADLQGRRATISVGVAGGLPLQVTDPYTLIGSADEALYRAKRDGRNVVRASTENVDAAASSTKLKRVDASAVREALGLAKEAVLSGSKQAEAIDAWAEAVRGKPSRVA